MVEEGSTFGSPATLMISGACPPPASELAREAEGLEACFAPDSRDGVRIDVSDDGTGIPRTDLDAVGRRNYTSKPTPGGAQRAAAAPRLGDEEEEEDAEDGDDGEDGTGATLYGFRGEALASIAEIALVTITTRAGAAAFTAALRCGAE